MGGVPEGGVPLGGVPEGGVPLGVPVGLGGGLPVGVPEGVPVGGVPVGLGGGLPVGEPVGVPVGVAEAVGVAAGRVTVVARACVRGTAPGLPPPEGGVPMAEVLITNAQNAKARG